MNNKEEGMESKMRNILKIVFVIIGTLIGAGFASGKEIYLFFAKFGIYGIIGIIISGIVTSIITYKTLKIVKQKQINNYKELLQTINPKGQISNKIVNYTVNAFLLTSFVIMVAGFSAYIKQTFNINTYISSLIFVLICYIILNQNINGVIKINQLLVPLLVIFIILLGIKNIPYILETSVNEVSSKGFIINSILYASYNSIILIPVLTSLRSYLKSEKMLKTIAIITGIIIIILALLIYALLLRGINYAESLDMPLLQIVKELGHIYKIIYEFVIIVSIFTSAVSTAYSFLENVVKKKRNYKKTLFLICIVGILVSNIGFSKLVQILYPVFGILGLIQIGFLGRVRKSRFSDASQKSGF